MSIKDFKKNILEIIGDKDDYHYRTALKKFDLILVTNALILSNYSMTVAADILGINRYTLSCKMLYLGYSRKKSGTKNMFLNLEKQTKKILKKEGLL